MTQSEKAQLKLEAFKLASLMNDSHSTEDLIKNANCIYESMLNN